LPDSLKKTFQSNLGELDNADMMLWLNKTIESEIIPRLLMGHQLEPSNKKAVSEARKIKVSQTQITDFCQVLLDGPIENCFSFIDEMQKSGHTLVSLYMNLIPASTRRLQHLWASDENSFTEVTMALGRAQNLIHQLSPIFMSQSTFGQLQGNALLINAPASQHTLGILILGEFFKLNGWNTTVEIDISNKELKERVKSQAFDVLAISISCEEQWDSVKSLLEEIKKVSKNKGMLTMMGGPLFDFKPELMKVCPADICTSTAEQAIAEVSERLSQRSKFN
jgi:methanogenic corrinoid protein MtbC1